MIWLYLVFRWMHVLAAAVLVGGIIFQRFAWVPARAGGVDDSAVAAIRSRWSKLVMGAIAFLVISGIVNFILILQRYEIAGEVFPGRLYHMLFGIKFLLALVLFYLVSVLSGRSATAVRFRQKEKLWLNVNVVLAVLIVCLGGILKEAERSPKSEPSAQSAASSTELHAGR